MCLVFLKSPNKIIFSFPGGKVEEKDNNDLVRTAVRECCEELSITPDSIDVWGQWLREAKYIRPMYLTIPVIANLGRIENLQLKMKEPSPEVESVLIGKCFSEKF